MKNLKTVFFTLLLMTFVTTISYAQRSNIKDYVSIEITPDQEDWNYRVGQQPTFQLRVVRNNVPLKNVSLSYEIGPEKMTAQKTGKSNLEKGVLTVKAGTLKTPGFMTCTAKVTVDGVQYTNYINVAFDAQKIQPTTTQPADFTQFWKNALADNAKIAMKPQMTLLPDECTADIDVYQVKLQHFKNGSYIYGKLCMPKAPGQYPAVLRVPGAGVKKNPAEMVLAQKGMITLSIGIHGIPLNMSDHIYSDLNNGVLKDYAFIHLDDKDQYYYKRVYTGCVRALDFLTTLPQYDGENLGVIGGSQGGALAMVTAALDHRVKALVAYYPALCDLTGYLHGRAGGWPAMFAPRNETLNKKAEKIETSRYYDVANFAPLIKAPGYYSWGYNDPTCPPTSYYAAYNVIEAPKELFVAQSTGHWRNKEQDLKTIEWFCKQLTK